MRQDRANWHICRGRCRVQSSADGGGEQSATKAPRVWNVGIGDRGGTLAQAFRESLLQEAAAQRFSQAASSVKYIQYEAAQRAYYVPRVRQAFPQLFTEAELRTLTDWFGAINRRALTVEWVDWMYAVALARWPRGPYENQENGAGLLSVLISGGLRIRS